MKSGHYLTAMRKTFESLRQDFRAYVVLVLAYSIVYVSIEHSNRSNV